MTTLDEFVRLTAASYLQSIVFVDDEIYVDPSPQGVSEISPGVISSLRPQFSEEQPGNTRETESSRGAIVTRDEILGGDGHIQDAEEGDKPTPHPRELMESFARKGIVCALYEPRKGFKSDPESDLFRLCERADIIILDWDLHNDDGDGVSLLLAELIKKSAADLPHHVRLCILYTSRPSLYPIIEQLIANLNKYECTVGVVSEKLQLVSGATRISILGKPHVAGRPPDDEPYVVPEVDLANRVIAEFANLHKGLMPAIALHGLSSIRNNTKRLLDKFHSELDGAFLLHRALVMGDHEAVEELSELLSDEIQAILEDTRLDNANINRIASATIEQLPITNAKRTWPGNGVLLDQVAIFRGLLLEGEGKLREALGQSSLKDELKDNGFRGIKPKLLTDFDKMVKTGGKSRTEELAALYCNRTQYGQERRLNFGTVIRHKENEGGIWQYSVCLMPLCDCQRLHKACPFPFWLLKPDARKANDGKRIGVVVIDPEGITQCLSAGGKIRAMLWTHEFKPGPECVVVATPNGNSFQFTTEGKIIEWVAELKPLHAQRIAAHLGTEVSRVGLVESEWLRLYCDR